MTSRPYSHVTFKAWQQADLHLIQFHMPMQTASGFLIVIWLQGNAIIITDQENKMYKWSIIWFDKLSHLHIISSVHIIIT